MLLMLHRIRRNGIRRPRPWKLTLTRTCVASSTLDLERRIFGLSVCGVICCDCLLVLWSNLHPYVPHVKGSVKDDTIVAAALKHLHEANYQQHGRMPR